MPGPDLDVAGKADITILRSGVSLWVLNGDDAPGDFVHVRSGRFVRWHNRTGEKCRLTFRTLPDADDPHPSGEIWPFDPDQSGGVRDLAPGEVWKAKLKTDIGSGVYVKYDVELPERPLVPKLDPVIIVRP